MANVADFSVVVATPGTRVFASAVDLNVNAFDVIAFPANTGAIGWGKSAVSMTRCLRLGPGDVKSYPPRKGGYNLRYYGLDSEVGGEGVWIIPS